MQIWWRRPIKSSDQAAGTITGKQLLTMTLDGKKEEQSCLNDKRNELCVSMATEMKDDKSSLQTLV